MVSKGQTRLVDARSPLCCPYLITWGTLCPLSLWMGSEIKRSHFDPTLCLTVWWKVAQEWVWSDGGWLVRWSLSAILLLGLVELVLTVPMLYRNCQVTSPWFGVRWEWMVPHGWAQGYSWSPRRWYCFHFPLRTEVVFFFLFHGRHLCQLSHSEAGDLKGLFRPGRPVVFPPLLFFLCARVLWFFLFSLAPVVSDWVFLALVVASWMKYHNTLRPPSSFLPSRSPGWAGDWVMCFPHSCASWEPTICEPVVEWTGAAGLGSWMPGCLLGQNESCSLRQHWSVPARGSRKPFTSAGCTAGPPVLWDLAQALVALLLRGLNITSVWTEPCTLDPCCPKCKPWMA